MAVRGLQRVCVRTPALIGSRRLPSSVFFLRTFSNVTENGKKATAVTKEAGTTTVKKEPLTLRTVVSGFTASLRPPLDPWSAWVVASSSSRC